MNSKSTFLWLSSLLFMTWDAAAEHTTTSPDSAVKVTLTLDQGFPEMSASYQGKDLLAPSPLKGFAFKNAEPLGQNVRLVETTSRAVDNTWTPAWGANATVRNHYNLYTFVLEEKAPPRRKIGLSFRLYNDGFAYRYEVPEQAGVSELLIANELNTYNFAGDYKTFVLRMRNYAQAYEGMYTPMKLSEIKDTDIVVMPLLIEAETCWLAIAEANLTDYAGMYLSGPDAGQPLQVVAEYAPRPPRNEGIKVKGKAPLRTPWRTFMIGDQPGRLIESELLMNLNPPSKIKDPSWIKPGKAAWPWWSGRIAMGVNLQPGETGGEDQKPIVNFPPSTAVMKHYIDFAARNGLGHLLVDAGWYSKEIDAWRSPRTQDITTMAPDRADHYSVREVIDYANAKGVGVHLWVHILSLVENMDAIKRYKQWGAAGIKVDSYGGDHQVMVNRVHDIIEACAKHEMLVNFHGTYKPTGIRRTWPNVLTREAVYALEQSKLKPGATPEHNVTIPFTRMLAGPMDYTPGAFDLDGPPRVPKQVQTTRAQQLAMFVVYFSGLQHLADYPAAYENSPVAFRFIKDVPATWDETRVIDGTPGDFIIMARKKAGAWFLGAMTDENARTVTIPLDFLDAGKTYRADIYKDGPDVKTDREDVAVEHKTLTSADTLKVRLAPGGGAALLLSPPSFLRTGTFGEKGK